ncbi:MAG: hypothetical protein GY802_09650 [Gammaproteobacteria bacterium]|nr:hypothetical protein [Gammaproteobacteria bacterium]
MFTILKKLAGAALATSLIVNTPAALASGSATYHVTITNVTHSITFTPILVASHRHPVGIFEPGAAAGDDLAAIAEGGDTSGLQATLESMPQVVDIQSSGGLLGPGQSVTVVVSAKHGARRISLASMMLPTNDGFIALDSVRAPRHGTATYYSPGYDAGTEANDELCGSIPGPFCGGAGPSPGDNPGDEKFVHIHRGMQGVGELDAAVYDWRNPVARITVTRIRH